MAENDAAPKDGGIAQKGKIKTGQSIFQSVTEGIRNGQIYGFKGDPKEAKNRSKSRLPAFGISCLMSLGRKMAGS